MHDSTGMYGLLISDRRTDNSKQTANLYKTCSSHVQNDMKIHKYDCPMVVPI